MQELIESGRRRARSMLIEGSQVRPQQFTLDDPTARRGARSTEELERSEELVEKDTTPEEIRPRRAMRRAKVAEPVSPRLAALRGTLGDRTRVRNAILVNEILSAPRAIRPYEDQRE